MEWLGSEGVAGQGRFLSLGLGCGLLENLVFFS